MPLSRPAHWPDFSGTYLDRKKTLFAEKLLGHGGFGAVYAVRKHQRAVSNHSRDDSSSLADSELPDIVAVKILIDNRVNALFEARVAQRVQNHPNVVKMYAAIIEGSFCLLAMQYYPEGDLHGAIQRGMFNGYPSRALDILEQIVDAVGWCHQRNVFIRDLKPENILVADRATKAAITDFGLAVEKRISSEFGAGSLTHMAPGNRI
jgi:serine/threonine protein kinase